MLPQYRYVFGFYYQMIICNRSMYTISHRIKTIRIVYIARETDSQ